MNLMWSEGMELIVKGERVIRQFNSRIRSCKLIQQKTFRVGVVRKLPKVELVTKHFSNIGKYCNARDGWGGVFECAIGFWYVNLCMNNGSLDAITTRA